MEGEKDLYLLPGFLPCGLGVHRVVLGSSGRTRRQRLDDHGGGNHPDAAVVYCRLA